MHSICQQNIQKAIHERRNISAGLKNIDGEPLEVGYNDIFRSITLTPCIDNYEARQRVLFQVGESAYILIQTCDNGWDYTIYDKLTLHLLDGGQLDMSNSSIYNAAVEICKLHEFYENELAFIPASSQKYFSEE